MSLTWIFQGNPDIFDIAGYLAAGLDRITWNVRRYTDKVQPGDRVFLWQAAGNQKAVSGIVAEAYVDSPSWSGKDHVESIRFYLDPAEAARIEARVWLKVVRVAKKKTEVIKRDWLLKDPVCSQLRILRQPNGTNYLVEGDQAQRLARLWERSGQDWNRAECVAAMLLRETLRGAKVSTRPGSPVAKMSVLVGRAVSSTYDKVFNFRAIDPRNTGRKGLGKVSEKDKEVWRAFFDPTTNQVRMGLLKAEFDRWWKDATSGTPAAAGGTVGTAYRPADESVEPEPPQSAAHDPDAVGRGCKAHNRTQNRLATYLSAHGLGPLSATPGDPQFDVAWKSGGVLYVAEVKSITPQNEEKQLRLGLGQVLRYRQRLAPLGQPVQAVLVSEQAPEDATWAVLCSSLGVILTWPDSFEDSPLGAAPQPAPVPAPH